MRRSHGRGKFSSICTTIRVSSSLAAGQPPPQGHSKRFSPVAAQKKPSVNQNEQRLELDKRDFTFFEKTQVLPRIYGKDLSFGMNML